MTFTCDASQGDANPFIERNFYDCVYTTRDLVGFSLGMVSILLWLVAQVPQLVSNIRNQSSEALSVWFLTQWFLGDTLNLLGCLISGTQLATTTYLAMYFVVSDVVMLTQFIYFGALKARKQKLLERFKNMKLHQHRHRHHHHRQSSLKREFGSESHPRPSMPSLSPGPLEYAVASEPFLRSDHRAMSEAALVPPTIQEEPGTPRNNSDDVESGAGGNGPAALDPATGSPYRTAALLVGGTATLSAVMLACVTLGMQYAQSQGNSGSGSSSGGSGGSSPPLWLEGLGWDGGHHSYSVSGTSSRTADGTGGGTYGDIVVRSSVAAVGPLSVLTALDIVSLQGQQDWEVLAGTAIGYCSSCLYIVSRLSQIFKNRSRQSAEGLSIAMFALAFCGNLCTGSSILLRATEWAALKTQLPWVCGTFGTVALDGFIFRQALLYGTQPKKVTFDEGTPDKRQYSRIDVG